jgi:hypothetical protein
LREAVVHFAGALKVKQIYTEEDLTRLSIPWKEVSTYIKHRGGSYSYGFATVKKKYVALLAQDQQQGIRRQASLARLHTSHASAL